MRPRIPQRLPGAAQRVQGGSKNEPTRDPRRVQVPLMRLSAGQAPPNDVATRMFWVQSLPKLAASTTKAQSNSTCGFSTATDSRSISTNQMYCCLDGFWTCRDLSPASCANSQSPWVPQLGPYVPQLGPYVAQLGPHVPLPGPYVPPKRLPGSILERFWSP